MAEPSNRDVVERYTRALADNDFAALPFLLGEDVVEDYPQSGERIVGQEKWIALLTAWPEHEVVRARVEQVVGSDDQWVPGPNWTVLRIAGTGDDFWIHGLVTYSSGQTWHMVQLLKLRDGRITRIRSYFAAPFAAAEWRRPFVQIVDPETAEA